MECGKLQYWQIKPLNLPTSFSERFLLISTGYRGHYAFVFSPRFVSMKESHGAILKFACHVLTFLVCGTVAVMPNWHVSKIWNIFIFSNCPL